MSVSLFEPLCLFPGCIGQAGKERDLMYIDSASLGHCLSQGLHSGRDPRAHVLPHALDGITTVTTFVLGRCGDGVYMCVATADKIIVMKYSARQGTFTVRKVSSYAPHS